MSFYSRDKKAAEEAHQHQIGVVPMNVGAFGGGGGGGAGVLGMVSVPQGAPRQRVREYSPAEKLCTRMGWADIYSASHSTYISVLEGTEKVFVFGVRDDLPFTLEDSKLMFPSDQLITQLRLLCE